MTTIKHLNGILAGLLLMAAGCADNNPWSESGDTGGLRPSVLVDASVGAAVTRAQMEEVPEADVPSANDFTLEITKVDGSYSKSWRMAEYDPASVELRKGKYIVTASYGNPLEEGNKRPYFVGSADVTITAGETTPVNIEAALGNALVEVTQTDNFLGYFSDFSLQLHSGETGAYVPVPRGQVDPTYVHPGQVAVVLSYTTWEGKSATIRPVTIDVKARKYYHVKLDLDTEMSGGVLKVTFDNGISEEEVDVDLSAVENAPAPEISASLSAEHSILEGTRGSEDAKFFIKAPAGIATTTLTLVSDPAYTFSYAGQDLCALDADGQAAIDVAGIKTLGLFKNRDKMAEIDLVNFASKLPEGSYEVTLTVTDAFTREAQSSMKFKVVAPKFEIESVDNPAYGSTEVDVTISYNGLNVADDLSFKVKDGSESTVDVTINDFKQLTNNEGAFPTNSFKVRLENVPKMFCSRDIWAYIGDKEVAKTMAIPAYPEFDVEVDAFAKRAYVKIKNSDSEIADSLRNKLVTKVCEAGSDTPMGVKVNRGKSLPSDIIEIIGFDPAKKYIVQFALEDCATPEKYNEAEFTTEAAADVPNGNFTETTRTIDIPSIHVGGLYAVNALGVNKDYQHTSSIVISEPNGWCSVNAKTCYEGSSNINTWYLVPSTFAEDEITTLRSVAYDHSGGNIETSGGSWNTHYYCENAPQEIKSRAAGELFLGSYSYDGQEHRVDGISFSSRPSSIEFAIAEYSPYNSDKGLVSVEILDESGNILSTNRAEVVAGGTIKLPLNNYGFGVKASKLRVNVRSSVSDNPETKIPSGSDLNENQSLGNHTLSANSYKALSTGSVLKISSIKLNYE